MRHLFRAKVNNGEIESHSIVEKQRQVRMNMYTCIHTYMEIIHTASAIEIIQQIRVDMKHLSKDRCYI